VANISDVKIDGRDARIIEALERDARTSFAEIARDCGVSIDTITKRYRNMLRPESRGRLCSPTR
jgi:DNA-binding Lrp family transcriptional regulator